MDFFDHGINYGAIVENINNEKNKIIVKYRANILKVIFVFAITAALVIYFLSSGGYSIELILIPVFGFILISVFTYAIGMYNITSKTQISFLNNEVINLYNNEEGTFIKYEIKPKINREFNEKMGLFTKAANVYVKYMISGDSANHHNFNIMNCRLISSNGQNSTVHFDGFYIIINAKTSSTFQLRTKGKPRLKGAKFVKLDRTEPLSFLLEEDPNNYIETKYYDMFDSIKSNIDCKALYISSNKEQFHIGIIPKEKLKFPSELDYETFKEYSDRMRKIINTAFGISSIIEDY